MKYNFISIFYGKFAIIKLIVDAYVLAEKEYAEILPRVRVRKVACCSAMSLRQQKYKKHNTT